MTEPDWHTRAKCRNMPLSTFFEDIWEEVEDEAGELVNVITHLDKLVEARSICDRCPVRRQCYGETMTLEAGAAPDRRPGFRAGMTGPQRWSAEHRSAVRCPVCNTPLDPNAVREGEVACVNECQIDRAMPAIPDEGDQWTRRHTTLARKIVRWLMEQVAVGEEIPRPHALAKIMNERRTDMCRVFDALVADGTLEFDGNTYRRRARIAAIKAWTPAHLVLLEADVA